MEIAAGEFKARCLRLMNQVRETGEEITITKHGKPVAKLVPVEPVESVSVFGWMRGGVLSDEDIVSPLNEEWDAQR